MYGDSGGACQSWRKIATHTANDAMTPPSTMRPRHAQVLTVLTSLAALVTPSLAGIRAPGRYTGVVVFDRWGGCVLCSGYDFNYVSESAKAPLEDQDRQRVELDATVVLQVINPGKALLKEFAQVWTKPPEPPPAPDPLRLSLQPAFADGEPARFEITAVNNGAGDMTLRYDALAAHVLTKREAHGLFQVSDSPSDAVLTAHFMLEEPGRGPTRVRGGGVLAGVPHAWYVTSAMSLPTGVILGPGERTSLTIAVDLPPGEYDAFAAYGHYTDRGYCTASNSVGFDIGADGLARLANAPREFGQAYPWPTVAAASNASGEVAKGVFGTFAILAVVGFTVWTVRRYVVRRRRLMDEWRRRPPVSDADFLLGCGIAAGSEDARRALLLRAACAKVTAVPPETIRPDDTLADPIWDSIGWIEVIMELEDAAGVSIPDEVFDAAGRAAGGSVAQARVRDLVRGVIEHARAGPPVRRTKITRRPLGWSTGRK